MDKDVADQLDGQDAQLMTLGELPAALHQAAEAIDLLRGMVADLVGRLPEADQEEYADDLAEVSHLASVLRTLTC